MSKKIFFSPAKINIFLEVLSRRNDGFHNLNSLMSFCTIGDFIEIKKSKKFSFDIIGPFSKNLLKAKNNIILDVIKKLETHLNRTFNISLKLKKNLPISSGLGGGSSNAAITIKALIEIFNLKIKENELQKILLSSGSDVPFCYLGKTSLVNGIGEKINPVDKIEELNILLVNPMIEVPTNEIFKKVIKFNTKPTTLSTNVTSKKNLIDILNYSKNDLQEIAIDSFSEIKQVLDFFNFDTNSIFHRMSGSGGTCLGFFNSYEAAKEAELNFKKHFSNWWIKSGKILNQL